MVESEPRLAIDVVDGTIVITHAGVLSTVELSFFIVDLEVVFSAEPFMKVWNSLWGSCDFLNSLQEGMLCSYRERRTCPSYRL